MTIYKCKDALGKTIYYKFVKPEEQIAPVDPQYLQVECKVCQLPYEDNKFGRVLEGAGIVGQPLYYKENWHEETKVKFRKIMYCYCSAECSHDDHRKDIKENKSDK